MAKPNKEVTNYTPSSISWVATNFKNYELTNHLGNVLATIKDEKKQVSLNGTTVDYYEPIIITANDYYPFGMVMPNRSFSLSSKGYRFGFNGKEKESDIYGESKAYAFEARFFDSRIGRFFSTDPWEKKYPWQTPFAYFANSPISKIDYLGMGDPLANMKIRNNRASNLFGTVRSIDGGVNNKNHQGNDYYAEVGTPIFAVKDAVVHKIIQEKDGGFYGMQIILKITNADGTFHYAQYAHLSAVNVKEGDNVLEKQIVPIGYTGTSGNASESSPHLHFELRTQENVGKGLGGRISPNVVTDTDFESQNPSGTQTSTGVVKIDIDGVRTNMDVQTNAQERSGATGVSAPNNSDGLPKINLPTTKTGEPIKLN
jgi:RHS repeat-associated protein